MTILLRILRKLKILRRIKIHRRVHLGGQSFTLPIINEVGFTTYNGLSEPWMTELLKKLIDKDKAFLDVGANVGQTLLKAKSIAPSIFYIGFEPNPVCVAYLNELIEQNQFTNTAIYPVAIGETTKISTLSIYNEDLADSSASVIDDFRTTAQVRRKVHIPSFRFSDLNVQTTVEVGIVKIDVEGAELEVLYGLTDLLNKDRPAIIMEILPAYDSGNTMRINRQNEILKFFGKLSFTLFRIKKTEESIISLEKIEQIEIHSDLNLCEYLAVPMEKRSQVLSLFSI